MALYRISFFSLVVSLGLCCFVGVAGAQQALPDVPPSSVQPASGPTSPGHKSTTSSTGTHASSRHVKHHVKHKVKHKSKNHKQHSSAHKKHHNKSVKKTTLLELKDKTQQPVVVDLPVKSTVVPAGENVKSSPLEKKVLSEPPPVINQNKLTSSKAPLSKSVAYTFCLGYDNCIPTRYEITGKQARVLQQNPEGHWIEAKANPVMAADLTKLANSETSSVVVRSLTSAEKAHIADHQGRIHAQLIGAIMAGNDKKDQAKALMREISIHNVSDLEAYDPKLGENASAREVARELSSERNSQSGG